MKKLTVSSFLLFSLAMTSCSLFSKNESVEAPVPFFTLKDGSSAQLYTIRNSQGMSAQISDFGGVIYSLNVPDKNNKLTDVILGFNSPAQYANPGPYFGALVGRYANRIKNGSFPLDGKIVQIKKNEGNNTLHGGDCFCYRPWKAKQISASKLELSLLSPDGDAGFPGNLSVKAVYEITKDNELAVSIEANTDAVTAVNMTSHGYYNLSGHSHGSISDHNFTILADQYQECDKENIPTGKMISVAGTPFDFRKSVSFQDVLAKRPSGFDHNFIIGNRGKYRKMATAVSRTSGIVMDVYSTDDSVQFYTAAGLNGSGKNGVKYGSFGAFCFEPQRYIDAVNHPEYPSARLAPGETYHQKIVYKFSIAK